MSSIDPIQASPFYFELAETKTALVTGTAFVVTSCVIVILSAGGVPLGTVGFSLLHGTNLAAFTGFVVSFYFRNEKIRALLREALEKELSSMSKLIPDQDSAPTVTMEDSLPADPSSEPLGIDPSAPLSPPEPKPISDEEIMQDFIAGVNDCIDALETYGTAYIKAYFRAPSQGWVQSLWKAANTITGNGEGDKLNSLHRACQDLKDLLGNLLQDKRQVVRFMAIGAFIATLSPAHEHDGVLSPHFQAQLDKDDETFFEEFSTFLKTELQIEQGYKDIELARAAFQKAIAAKKKQEAEGTELEGSEKQETEKGAELEDSEKQEAEVTELEGSEKREEVNAEQKRREKQEKEIKKDLDRMLVNVPLETIEMGVDLGFEIARNCVEAMEATLDLIAQHAQDDPEQCSANLNRLKDIQSKIKKLEAREAKLELIAKQTWDKLASDTKDLKYLREIQYRIGDLEARKAKLVKARKAKLVEARKAKLERAAMMAEDKQAYNTEDLDSDTEDLDSDIVDLDSTIEDLGKVIENLKHLYEVRSKIDEIERRHASEDFQDKLGEAFLKTRVPYISTVVAIGEQIKKLWTSKKEDVSESEAKAAEEKEVLDDESVVEEVEAKQEVAKEEPKKESKPDKSQLSELEKEELSRLDNALSAKAEAQYERAKLTIESLEAQRNLIDGIMVHGNFKEEELNAIYAKVVPFILKNIKTPLFYELIPLALDKLPEELPPAQIDEKDLLTRKNPVAFIYSLVFKIGKIIVNNVLKIGLNYAPIDQDCKNQSKQIVGDLMQALLKPSFYATSVRDNPFHAEIVQLIKEVKSLSIPAVDPQDGDKGWQGCLKVYADYIREKAKTLDDIKYKKGSEYEVKIEEATVGTNAAKS